jgi:alanine racemase
MNGDFQLMVSEQAWAEVHLNRIRHNVQAIRQRLNAGVKLMAVVKGGGYGHGTVQAAKAAVEAGAEALAVSDLEEALLLRRAEIAVPILVLSPISPLAVDKAADFRIDLTVFQEEWIKAALNRKTSALPLRVHIKMDTGMGRLGLRERADWERLVPWLRSKQLLVAGVYTHFSSAGLADRSPTDRQFQKFQEMRRWVAEAGFDEAIAHCANSAAAIRFPEYALDMVRVGASLYGILPMDAEIARTIPLRLMPTFSLHTVITHIKQVAPGETVGYDGSYTARETEWIATLPIGYADGWFRGYRGFHVQVNGAPAPIVGNICMNQTMIRLPCKMPVGTKVTLIGAGPNGYVSLDALAAHAGTIPQQVLTMISERIPKIYIDA